IPTALLYLMLHHALDLSYVEVSLILHQKAELISQQEAGRARIEPSFVHVQQGKRSTESRWQYLYSNPEVITGDAEVSVGAYIPTILKTEVATAYLYEQVKAMEVLKNVPTSRLERVFAEHIDCCSYRLDAWKGAIMNFRLSEMREASNPNNETYTKGIFLGAYGYLENLRPENKVLTPVALEDRSLNEIFIKDQNEQLVSDKTNGGYIMAPSLNHAVTASILRNGYISNDTPDALRVNLSSERVRKALSVIEGIRGGQSLGALLGYYLERGLHESHPGVELDYFIYQLRKAFPLVSNKNKDTNVDESSPQPISSVEAIEARNVIDGLAVIEQIKLSGTATYPFGKSFLPAVDVPAQATAINEEVQKIMDINDAVADVAIAESVHQIVQGNYDRGAATLDTFSKGNFPPIPDVIQTPRTGINITHRIGLQLKTGIDPAAGLTPRAQAEPAMNDWLKSVLPVAADIVCLASYGTVIDEIVSVSMLGLEPIDLLYLINTESDQAMKEIDDRVVKFILDKPLVRPDTQVSIDYMKRVAGKYSFFELAPLVKSLRSLLLASRPLQANDVLLPTSSPKNTPSQEFLNDQRLVLRYTKLFSVLNNELKALALASSTLVSDAVANRAQILAQADQLSQDLEKILFEMSASGLPQSGFGYIAEARGNVYRSVIKKFNEIISSWDTRMDAFDKLMDDYNSLGAAATIDEKFTILQRARSEVSTTAPLTLPADPDIYRGNVLAMRGLFASKQNELKAVTSATSKSVAQLLSDANAALVDVSNYDLTNRSVKPEEDQLIFFVQDIALKAKQLTDDLFARLAKTKTLIDEAGLTTDGTKRVKNLLEAGKLLFHEDFKIIPEFTVDDDTGQQWANSFAQRDLLMHYSNQEGIDFPEDNWLYGIARVREKMHHWENITLLCEAFGVEDMQLHPVQFPFVDNDSWLGLSFPSTYNIDSERLLYTAFYADGFDKAKKQCGLLVDEWTEVIPSKKETAGIAFHFDRPNTEPPQVMLLAMPSEFTGAWKWEDLLDTVIETFKMAKGRGIQPSQIDGTGYGRFLPAVISSMVAYPVTPSLNFSFNNNIHEQFLNLLHE
ncbi:MAG TPA: hypothetical protein VNR87_02235, partial [Flavisolibacter sp.]|nr:hypothetical protein [Flavisolibacter sp.]